MTDYVFPNCQAVVRWRGGRIHLHLGQQWPADDPFVRERPEFFNNDPAAVSQTDQVERATRGPGEQRTARPLTGAAAKAAAAKAAKDNA